MAYFSRVTRLGAFSLLVLGCGPENLRRGESDDSGSAGMQTTSSPSPAAAGVNAATGMAGGTTGQATASVAGSPSTTQHEQSLAGAAGTGNASIAGSSGVPSTAGAPTTIRFDGVPSVGAPAPSLTVGGPKGTVRAVTALGDGVSLVTVQYEPAWNCPADAITSNQAGTTRTTSSTAAGSIELATVDCHTLAALRRPALKAQSLAQLANQRASLVYAQCQTRSASWCVDASGAKVEANNCYVYES